VDQILPSCSQIPKDLLSVHGVSESDDYFLSSAWYESWPFSRLVHYFLSSINEDWYDFWQGFGLENQTGDAPFEIS
jgi:hypothetical protein